MREKKGKMHYLAPKDRPKRVFLKPRIKLEKTMYNTNATHLNIKMLWHYFSIFRALCCDARDQGYCIRGESPSSKANLDTS